MNKIREGIGDKIANFLQWTAAFISGIIMGIAYGWKLALVIIATSPLLVICGGLMTYVSILFVLSTNHCCHSLPIIDYSYLACALVVCFSFFSVTFSVIVRHRFCYFLFSDFVIAFHLYLSFTAIVCFRLIPLIFSSG